MTIVSNLANMQNRRKAAAGILALATNPGDSRFAGVGRWGITTNNTEAAPGMGHTANTHLTATEPGDNPGSFGFPKSPGFRHSGESRNPAFHAARRFRVR